MGKYSSNYDKQKKLMINKRKEKKTKRNLEKKKKNKEELIKDRTWKVYGVFDSVCLNCLETKSKSKRKKKKKWECRAKLNVFNLKKNKR